MARWLGHRAPQGRLCSLPLEGHSKDRWAGSLEQRTFGGQQQRGSDLVKVWLRQGSGSSPLSHL